MRPIGPHELEYLRYPLMSTGEDMLYYAIEHLCFIGALDLRYWKVPVHPNNPHLVMRLFLTRRSDASPSTSAEMFALDLFPEGRTIHLGELRGIINERVKEQEMHAFKSVQVRADLERRGLLRFSYWPTAAGREARRTMKQRLRTLEHTVATLIERDRAALDAQLAALGSSVVAADDDTRTHLKKLKGRTPDLGAVFAIGSFLAMEAVRMDPSTLSGLSYSGGTGGSFGGGGFGGFGGGSFGGGGAGGSW